MVEIIRRKEQYTDSIISNLRGGKGDLLRKDIFSEDEMHNKVDWCVTLTIPDGHSIGEHPHGPDAEIYYILSGSVRVTDAGITEDLTAGDCVFTGGGAIHSLENVSGQESMVLAIKIK